MLCCRYMKFEHARNSLLNQFFKVSKPSEFNDPFECRGKIVNVDQKIVRKFVHDNFDHLRGTAIISALVQGCCVDQDAITEDFVFNGYWQTVVRESGMEMVGAAEEYLLMMCFANPHGLSERSDVLFWSHYADSGKGVRISFDLPENDLVYHLHKVRYVDSIPEFDAANMKGWLKGAEFQTFLEQLTYTKGKAWEPENEVRMIIPRCEANKLPSGKLLFLQKNIRGRCLEFIRIDPEIVSRIDFGPCANRLEVARLCAEMAALPEYEHVRFFNVNFHPQKYAYQYEKMEV